MRQWEARLLTSLEYMCIQISAINGRRQPLQFCAELCSTLITLWPKPSQPYSGITQSNCHWSVHSLFKNQSLKVIMNSLVCFKFIWLTNWWRSISLKVCTYWIKTDPGLNFNLTWQHIWNYHLTGNSPPCHCRSPFIVARRPAFLV